MMRIMRLGRQIADRELYLMDPEAVRLVSRRQSQLGTEIRRESRRPVRSVSSPSRRKGGANGGRVAPFPASRRCIAADAAVFAVQARHIEIIRAGVFQSEAHEFAASLNLWPIVEFVRHPPAVRFTSWRCSVSKSEIKPPRSRAGRR